MFASRNVDDRMLNIVGVGTFPPHQGGSALSTYQLLEGIAARGHKVRMIAPSQFENPEEHSHVIVQHVAVTWFRTPIAGIKAFKPLPEDYIAAKRAGIARLLPQLIAEDRPDLVFIGREGVVPFAVYIAQSAGIPTMARAAGSVTLGMLNGDITGAYADVLVEACRALDVMVAPAHHLARRARERGLYDMKVIPNAVDRSSFRPGPKDSGILERLDIDPGAVVVAHISNPKEIKRPEDVMTSAVAALRENPCLIYLFFGEGDGRHQLEAQAEALGIRDKVRFSGWVPYREMPRYLRCVDIVVMPGRDETMARVYLETLASGRVLVASSIFATREIITDGENGFLFPVGDTDAIARLTLELAADPDRRNRVGRAAREMSARFNLDDTIDSYIALMRETVAAHATVDR